jgi:tetratricopeptide (TPR) repeat protein
MKLAWNILSIALLLGVTQVVSSERERRADSGMKTVLGPDNQALYDGAQALLAGDYYEGIRLTRLGLDDAFTDREKQAGLSNLCAGYLQIKEWQTALEYCDQALAVNPRNWRALNNRAILYIQLEQYSAAKNDLDLAGEIAPNARTVKAALALYLNATEPVVPNVEIDDRRQMDPVRD